MQDSYVGDIGDFGKYLLLRLMEYNRLRLAVNWYYVIPDAKPTQNDGKFIQYLLQGDKYRKHDNDLFDALHKIVIEDRDRRISRIEKSSILNASFFTDPVCQDRTKWHEKALLATKNADLVFLDPDNGLETEKMSLKSIPSEKHVRRNELKDYYDRGQSVILYQHKIRETPEQFIQKFIKLNEKFVRSDKLYILDFPKRYYFIFSQKEHSGIIGDVCHYLSSNKPELCKTIFFED